MSATKLIQRQDKQDQKTHTHKQEPQVGRYDILFFSLNRRVPGPIITLLILDQDPNRSRCHRNYCDLPWGASAHACCFSQSHSSLYNLRNRRHTLETWNVSRDTPPEVTLQLLESQCKGLALDFEWTNLSGDFRKC